MLLLLAPGAFADTRRGKAPPGTPPGAPGAPSPQIQSPFLGLLTEPVPDGKPHAGEGVAVLSVLAGTPAELARIQEGDIVISVGGRPVPDPESFLRAGAALPFDTPASLSLLRGENAVTATLTPTRRSVLTSISADAAQALVERAYVEIKLAAAPRPSTSSPGASLSTPDAASGPGFLGVQVADNPNGPSLEEQGIPRGAMVRDVIPGSAAQGAGIIPGDVITWASGRPVNGAADLTSMVAGMPSGTQVEISVQRGDQQLTLSATLAARNR